MKKKVLNFICKLSRVKSVYKTKYIYKKNNFLQLLKNLMYKIAVCYNT